MGGAWRLASFIPNSFICCGSQNEAHTSLASFWWSPISGTANNSAHQPGVLQLLGLHSTHWLNSGTLGSGGILLPLSSEVPSDPLKKDAPSSPSSCGSSKSEPLAAVASSPDSILWPEGQGGPQTAPDGVSSSTPPYYIPGSPCSWISPSLPGSSGCDLVFLFPLQG